MEAAALETPPALCALELDGLSKDEQLAVLAATERQLAQLAAVQQEVIAALASRVEDGAGAAHGADKQWVREDIATVLRLSSGAARVRIENACSLVQRLPATLALLARGDISLRHATTLAEASHPLADEVLAQVETRVLRRAAGQSVANFRAGVERAVAALDRRREDEAHADARADRHVVVRDGRHGMADVRAYLPAEDARTLAIGVQAMADAERQQHQVNGVTDERSADQRRADALVALAQHALTGCPPAPSDGQSMAGRNGERASAEDAGGAERQAPVRIRPISEQGRRPAVQVTVALSTLLGVDDQPGELDGHGPITADHARRIAADPSSTWWRLITDAAGRLLDYGHTRYRPPQSLIDHVTARDQRCRFPHCTRPARRCELDHVEPYGPAVDDGRTRVENLVALCPRHHHLKHEAGWTLSGDPEGVLVWRSPTGRTYTTEPGTLPVDGTGVGAADDDDAGRGHAKAGDEPDRLDWTPRSEEVGARERAEVETWLDLELPRTFELVGPEVAEPWLDQVMRPTGTAVGSAADDPPPF